MRSRREFANLLVGGAATWPLALPPETPAQPEPTPSECHAKWPDRSSNAMQEPATPEVSLISGRDF
jgi:hypothetical protein